MRTAAPVISLTVLFLGLGVGWVSKSMLDARASGARFTIAGHQTNAHAKALLDRVASDVIGEAPRPEGGVNFFAVPRPFGESLCQVNLIGLSRNDPDNAGSERDNNWSDDLSISAYYEVVPQSLRTKADSRRKALCADFRDLRHLIRSDDGASVDRVVQILSDLRTDPPRQANIDVECGPSIVARRCSVSNLIAVADVSAIRLVVNRSTEMTPSEIRRTDEYQVISGKSGCHDSSPVSVVQLVSAEALAVPRTLALRRAIVSREPVC